MNILLTIWFVRKWHDKKHLWLFEIRLEAKVKIISASSFVIPFRLLQISLMELKFDWALARLQISTNEIKRLKNVG